MKKIISKNLGRNQNSSDSKLCDFSSLDFIILASTNQPEELIKAIKKELSNHPLDEAMFQRMKKVWIANEVKIADSIDATVNNVYDDIIRYHRVIPNKVDVIRSMDMKTLEKIVSQIDFHNLAVVTMLPKEEELVL